MFKKIIMFKKMTNSGLFATMFASACLTACHTIENRTTVLEAPDISYPGLSVYGLAGVPPAEVTTPWSSSICLYRHDSIKKSGFVGISAGKPTQVDNVQKHIDFRLAQAPLDICHIVTDGDAQGKACYNETLYPVSYESNLTINRPGQSPLAIQPARKTESGNSYLTGALPAGTSLSLSLSSATFPKVAAYSLSDTITPENQTPDSATWVNVDTKYTWKPSNDPSSYIEILFYSTGPNKWTNGQGLRCDVVDDGEFKLPSEALELVQKYENSLKAGYSRITRRMDYQDGVLFYYVATAIGDLSGI